MAPSQSLEAAIRERAALLGRFFERIVSVRAVVEARHRHSAQGRIFHVRVEVSIPGDNIVITRDPKDNHAHEDPYVSVRDAFDAAERRLEDRNRRMRGDVKPHQPVNNVGRISHVSAPEDFGFIASIDGENVYFHRNSLVGIEMEAVTEGDEVHFTRHDADGAEGPHASGVRVTKKASDGRATRD